MMDTFAVLLVQLAIAGAVATICGVLAKRKSRDIAFWGAFGMVATFLIWVPIGIMAGWGPFMGAIAGGVATIAVLASMAPLSPCPMCGGPILPTAKACQYCGGKLISKGSEVESAQAGADAVAKANADRVAPPGAVIDANRLAQSQNMIEARKVTQQAEVDAEKSTEAKSSPDVASD